MLLSYILLSIKTHSHIRMLQSDNFVTHNDKLVWIAHVRRGASPDHNRSVQTVLSEDLSIQMCGPQRVNKTAFITHITMTGTNMTEVMCERDTRSVNTRTGALQSDTVTLSMPLVQICTEFL